MLEKNYNSKEIEAKWHKIWEDEGLHCFDPATSKPVYSFDTPPPFTSGTLHMGHIFNHVWIDVVARYKRMRGFSVYLPQGFDCHGLPTELRVEKELKVKKEDREEFIQKCVEWTDSAVARMRSQFERIGYSSDWRYTYRTMDEEYKATVQKTLLMFYERDLLYRGKHPVIWCPRCETALAKAEIGHIETAGKLYHIDLFSEGHKITIATTRPEMMPACVAVFVAPGDDRYEKFIGKKAKLPIFERDVPIIADEAVDPSFGTGVVYLCTFGDDQDIAWQRKYGLPVIEAIDEGGHMTKVAEKYAGMKVKDARKKIAEDLMEAGYLRKIEDITHQVVSHTERGSCKSPIELLPLEQWFINVRDYTKDIVRTAREMNWYPEYMLQRLVDWCESMDWDWIISRQRVFGTPIPFWVCACGEVISAREDELPIDPRGTTRQCPACGGLAKGEEDVCDCWVDSSVTPLVISKWGIDEAFFSKTYPVSLRPQGYEIIRTWAFYTIYRTLMLTDVGCFKALLVNGMVAGPDGRKMSKSLGNVIEPDEPLAKYSADTIRQWACLGALGADYPFSWEECEHSQKFLTKLWHVSRFIESHIQDYNGEKPEKLSDADKWILSHLQHRIEDSTNDLDRFAFNIPLEGARTFLWHDIADNYLEFVKHRLYKPEIYGQESRKAAQYTLYVTLKTLLKLLSPYMPHVCDEIWSGVFKDGYASVSEWPQADKSLMDAEAEKAGSMLVDIIGWVRKYKSDMGRSLVSELDRVEVIVAPELKDTVEKLRSDIMGTGKIKELTVSAAIGETLRVVVHE